MKYIEDLDNIENIKKLYSKRNSVYLIRSEDNNYVIKKFNEKEFFERELAIYNLLEKEKSDTLKYPQIISYSKEDLTIRFDYIKGETLLSNFEGCEQNNNIDTGTKIMILFFQWIQLFQSSLTNIKYKDELSSVGIYLDSEIINNDKVVSFNDINFKNFIQKDNILYGLDFENVNIDSKIKDYSKSLAYMMTYRPIGSKYKKIIFNYLIVFLGEKYNFSIESIYETYNNELKKIQEKRNIFLEDLYTTKNYKNI